LNDFCIAYLDNIFIYSNTEEKYKRHVRAVLKGLRKAGLYLDIKKCEFGIKTVKYLDLIIIDKGIKMDPVKVEAIYQW
jgi:hypothetical protein